MSTSAIDPQVAQLVSAMQAAGLPHLTSMTPVQARAFARARAAQSPPAPLHAVRDLTLDGPERPLTARLYVPTPSPAALVTYFHGGGWVIGDLETHDAIVRRLALASGCACVAVDYRLAPEHPFPAAVEDAWAAVQAVDRLNHSLIGPDIPRAVAGDSAGATLATVCALLARDARAPALAAQLLLYPPTSGRMDSASMLGGEQAPVLDSSSMRWFWDHYAPPASRRDWRASPLDHSDLAGVAPAIVVTAGFDPLRDEGEAYAARLRSAGVAVTLQTEPGLVHGFAGLAPFVDAAEAAMDKSARTLRSLCAVSA